MGRSRTSPTARAIAKHKLLEVAVHLETYLSAEAGTSVYCRLHGVFPWLRHPSTYP